MKQRCLVRFYTIQFLFKWRILNYIIAIHHHTRERNVFIVTAGCILSETTEMTRWRLTRFERNRVDSFPAVGRVEFCFFLFCLFVQRHDIAREHASAAALFDIMYIIERDETLAVKDTSFILDLELLGITRWIQRSDSRARFTVRQTKAPCITVPLFSCVV